MKKKTTLATVIVTLIGAVFWIVISCFHIRILANTTALILMISFAVAWCLGAMLRIRQYLKQRKQKD